MYWVSLCFNCWSMYMISWYTYPHDLKTWSVNYACKNKNSTVNYLPKYCSSRGTNRPSRSWKPVASGWLVYREGNMCFDFICEPLINWSYILIWFHSGLSDIVISYDISPGIEIEKRRLWREIPDTIAVYFYPTWSQVSVMVPSIWKIRFETNKGKYPICLLCMYIPAFRMSEINVDNPGISIFGGIY